MITEHLLIRLAEGDDVAVARIALDVGASATPSGGPPIRVRTAVPAGHKVALHDLRAGDLVRKYGHVIGVATARIQAGEHVHTHNLAMPDAASTVASGAGTVSGLPPAPPGLRRAFDGYRRPGGRVATRNYVGVLTTVNCSATVARQVVRRTEDDIASLHGEGATVSWP